MRKDIKKRLEKALMTLQEPGGSTIRSIIKVINKDSPVLTLRKVLEALQEGINEGFLCMYNGRFKLKQQTCSSKSCREQDLFLSEEGSDEDKNREEIHRTSDSDMIEEESDQDTDEEHFRTFAPKNALMLKKNVSKRIEEPRPERKSKRRYSKKHSNLQPRRKKTRCFSRNSKSRCKGRHGMKKVEKWCDTYEIACDSLLDITPGLSKKELTCKQVTEKPDVKKQRGPRCTSMKKDIRMPSKVHIPFLPPTVPQRNNFNDLLRRSPDPVNGPLFDCHKDLSLMPENLGFFGSYC